MKINIQNGCAVIKFESCKEFIDYILWEKQDNLLSSSLIYRGESTNRYKLIPSALRKNNKKMLCEQAGIKYVDGKEYNTESAQINLEYMALRNFFLFADKKGLLLPNVPRMRLDISTSTDAFSLGQKPWIPDDLTELAGLAQHYGINTRLLDWTSDFFVALYFAASNAVKSEVANNQKNTSDYMVIWALDTNYFNWAEGHREKIPIKIIRPPYYANPNLSSQSGLFTLYRINCPSILPYPGDNTFHNLTDRTPFDKLLKKHMMETFSNFRRKKGNVSYIYKFMIPIGERYNLLAFLNRINYDASRIFPGYSSIKEAIKDRLFSKTT